MRIVTVHGFNVKDGGKSTINKLCPLIKKAGWSVDIDDGKYGYINLLTVRLFNRSKRKEIIHRLADAFDKADVIITHSNGANYATHALNTVKGKKLVIHISPALNTGTKVPESVHRQLVLYTPHDGWVRLASFLPAHPWGRMGARGYLGDDMKVVSVMDASVKGHSKWFLDAKLERTWSHCLKFLKDNLE